MTEDAGPPPPSSSSSSAGSSSRLGARPGARSGARRDDRALLESIETNLAFMRPELERLGGVTRDHAGRLAEELPRLDDLDDRVATLCGRLDALAGAEPDDEATAPPYDPAALLAAGLDPAPGHQVDWHLMSAEQALPAWEALATWVATVVCGRLGFTRTELPDCWALHLDVVAELSWAHQLHRLYTGPGVGPTAVAEWHTRWLPHLHARLAALLHIDTLDPRTIGRQRDQPEDLRPRCRPGHYHQLTDRHREQAEGHLVPLGGPRAHGAQGAHGGIREVPPAGYDRDIGERSWITGLLLREHGPEASDHDRAARDRRRYRAQAILDGTEHPAPGPPERPRYLIAHPGDDHPVIGSPAALRAEPRHWLRYYFEAAHADLARRRHREHHGHPRPVDVALGPDQAAAGDLDARDAPGGDVTGL